jgi:hypothetical protein
MSMRTSEEGIKLHRFAGILPEQFLTKGGRHREAVLAADQRMVIRCFGDNLVGFVDDVSHVPSVLLLSAPLPERSKIVTMMVSHFA